MMMDLEQPKPVKPAVIDLSQYVGKSAHEATLPLYSLEQLREKSAAVSWLVKGAIPADSLGVMFGGSGTFKSFVALDLALHVGHGLPWLGRKTTQGQALYIAAEGGSGLWKRVDAWHRARRLQWPSAPLYVVPVAVDLGVDCLRVQEAARALGIAPALVVVDTLSQTFSGEENSANEVAGYLRELGTMLRAVWSCAVLVIHHSGHQATERPRGSSTIRNNVDFMFGVYRDEKEMLVTLTNEKQKDGEAIDDATFSLARIELGADADGDNITSLAARHLTSAEEVERASAAESAAGRGGKNQLFLSLVQNGEQESALRRAFYNECQDMEDEARRKAYFRSRAWALKNGIIDVTQGVIVALRKKGQ